MKKHGRREGAAGRALIALGLGCLLAVIVVPQKARAAEEVLTYLASEAGRTYRTYEHVPPLTPALSLKGERGLKLAVLAVFAAVDYGQSCKAFYRDGHFNGSYELNPVLGRYPSRADMLAFGAAGITLTWLAGEILPEPWGDVVIDSVLASQGMNIEENARVQDGRPRLINAIPIIVSLKF